jgi:hypothetical protein
MDYSVWASHILWAAIVNKLKPSTPSVPLQVWPYDVSK